MLKGINAWTAPDTDSFEKIFTDFAAAGYECVELNYESSKVSEHSLTPQTTDEECQQIRALADKAGIRITSICAALFGSTLGAEERSENERGMDLLRRQLRMAKILGCRSILIYLGGFSEKRSLAASYERAMEVMREMKPEIEAQDVLVGIENANQFFMSPFDYARFLDELDCDKVGAYLDFANVQIFQYPFSDHWLEVLGKRVINVHIKDYLPKGLGIGVFVPLLAGEVPYTRIMPMLREIGYDGPLVVELPHMMPTAPQYCYLTARMALEEMEKF